MKKNKHKCLICGRPLSKVVGYRKYKLIRTAPSGWKHYSSYPTELEARMAAASMCSRQVKATAASDMFGDWYIQVVRNGGGWQGLNKVCGKGNLKCLKKFVKRAVLPEKTT